MQASCCGFLEGVGFGYQPCDVKISVIHATCSFHTKSDFSLDGSMLVLTQACHSRLGACYLELMY